MTLKLSTYLKKHFLRPILLFIIATCLLLTNNLALADFRKALDAYQKHEGAVMLAEAKDAVDKKNNAGLKLFLSAIRIDASTSVQADISRIWGGDKAKHFIPEDKVITTLNSILNKPQQDELFKTLQMAVDNDSVDMQFDFTLLLSTLKRQQRSSSVQDEYAQKGSYVAKLATARSLIAKAELGDPASQLSLGLKYLNFSSDWGYGCWEASKTKEAICQTRDEDKGYFWLKESLRNYEKRRFIEFDNEEFDGFGVYSDLMCSYFNETANGDKKKLRQAYLWCVVGVNSGSPSSWRLLDKMNESGNLKIAAPETAEIWGMSIQQDRDRLFKTLNLSEFKELPNLIVEVQKELPKENLPVFSYYFGDYRLSPYLLDVYKDGRVNISFNNFYSVSEGDLLIKVSPKTVQKFLEDLKRINFNSWTLFETQFQFCDNFDPCIWTFARATLKDGNKIRRVNFKDPAYSLETNSKGVPTKHIAQLNALVEKYFPSKTLRCELGSSEGFKHACLERINKWELLANSK